MPKKDKKNESDGVHFTGDYTLPSTRESALGHAGNAISIAIEPFEPLFGIVDQVVKSLYTIYENAKQNKRICEALIDRIEVAEHSTKSLRRKKQKNAKKFSDEKYYHAWVRFTNVLKNIKDFAEDVTQQSMIRKHLNANAVKEAYDKNIKEFEDVCKDLHFAVFMISVEEREQENEQILNELNLLARINILSEQLNSHKLNPGEIKVPCVKSSELTDPKTKPGNVRGSERTIVKRIYRETLQVACKKVQAIGKNLVAGSRNIQTQLVILDLLGKCPNIITFYGLSKINQIDYMVFEWAEHGSLKEVYEKSSIPLPTKLQFISNIFKGLYFIFNSGVLHHDVRCENILVTEIPFLDVKISNFEMSRQIDGISTTIPGLKDYVRWLAPEKMSWDDDPGLRISYPEILALISNLERSVQLNSPRIYPKNETHDDIPDSENISPHYDIDPQKLPDWDECDPGVPTFSIIKPFEDGIKAHKMKQYKEAWEYFNEHADLGLSLAKYWKGYYLLKGLYGKKDVKEGLELLKSAADDGVLDAQFRYAKGLMDLNGSSENYEIILKYMNEAADGGNGNALYNLSEIYFNGKLGVKKDEKKGNEYFKLAALKNPKFKKPT
ncbi:5257_t:CDS:2 [Diversispora eburnea]|uniref:5257_t:CDS:1 n=1 Tax=Diversispora eburnea TaxID=1213867 RepID=A0A9N8ZHI7_9GLOM|nr:5257_t:CDS:2 [Diversispora eburnea]